MKKFALVLWLMAGVAVAGTPVVSNVRGNVLYSKAATQVEVWYDLAHSQNVRVSLQASDDGGNSWNVSVLTPSGAGWGNNVPPGKDRYILWKAGSDWPEHSAEVRFRVTASDDAPAPTGMALIPAGSFQMGNCMDPNEGWSAELPVHAVNVSAFYMDKYEVTKELWDEVRAWGLNNGYTDLDVGNGGYASKGANHPVHSISWYSMVKWCNARSKKAGLTECYTVGGSVYKTGSSSPVLNMNASGYRLPTEAEWEKAARGGLSGKRFPWGDTINHSYANYYNSTYAYESPQGAGYHPTYNNGVYPYSSPVGSFDENEYGLHDMAGNMWEWCWDWHGSYGSGSSSDPTGPASGSYRVIRGGCWISVAGYCRVAYRNGYLNPAGSYYGIGFRCARSSVP